LALSRPFGTEFVSRGLTQGFKALHILKQLCTAEAVPFQDRTLQLLSRLAMEVSRELVIADFV
jgi:hypothetical protein